MSESAFLLSGPLQTERMSDGRRRLLRDLTIHIRGDEITVPVDTKTDYSSIPWFGRMLVHWSKVDIAGVVHDWLYRTGYVSRPLADRYWRLVALAGDHHANFIQAWIGWFCLRVGGWVAWNRHRRNDMIMN